ncbi:MAG TPA: hypothetical protein V6D37_02630 [Candidatus Sericytochromatia bacterium]
MANLRSQNFLEIEAVYADIRTFIQSVQTLCFTRFGTRRSNPGQLSSSKPCPSSMIPWLLRAVKTFRAQRQRPCDRTDARH